MWDVKDPWCMRCSVRFGGCYIRVMAEVTRLRNYDVRVSRTSRSVCRSSSVPVDLGQWKAGRGGDGWRRGGSSVTVSNALTDWCLISHAVCIHSLCSKALLAILTGKEPHR